MKPLFAILVFSLSCCQAVASPNLDVFCVSEVSESNPKNLEIKIYNYPDIKWNAAYAKYQKSKVATTLLLESSKSTRVSSNVPDEREAVWREYSKGQLAGSYHISIQGAQIINFEYVKNIRTQPVFFVPNFSAYSNEGCNWEEEK